MSTPPGELVRDDEWQRLDRRMLLIHPVKELLRFLPVLIGVFVAGTASGGMPPGWQLLGVGVPVALGLLRYLTTSFRITEGRIELRRGLLNRHTLSTRLDLVRTVEVTASPIHRVLGLTTVRVGTGTASTKDEDRLDLDGLPAARARALRADLLHATGQTSSTTADFSASEDDERLVLAFDLAWIRFAPLTSTGVAVAAGVLGAGSQAIGSRDWFNNYDPAAALAGGGSWWLLVLLLVVAAVAVSVLAIAGYLLTNWGFTLTHTRSDGAWHLRRGLLTTRETSLDGERVRGVSIGEPLGLRLAGGGRLSAVVTGLDRKEQGSSVLVPPAPRAVVERVAAAVLGTGGPVKGPLLPHGRRATTRRFTRALLPAVVTSVGLVIAVVVGGASTWLLALAVLAPVMGVALAADRSHTLGHALVERHFVARSGSLYRQREAIATDAIIGWNFRSTWFQRRAGLTTLVATMAGGSQSCTAIDVPEVKAVAVASAAGPGLVEQFLR